MSIKHCIQQDIKWNCTPDLATLRYTGDGIPVFLWDSLTNYENLGIILSSLVVKDHYASVYHNAVTDKRYVPWYNINPSSQRYDSYCLEEHEDVEYVEVPGYSLGDPLPIMGKFCYISLKAIQELDLYYENERDFTRKIIKVKPSRYAAVARPAYAWFNTVDQLTEFNSTTSEYDFASDIDVTPFATETHNKEDYYKY